MISVRGACPKEMVQPKCDELFRVCEIITERLSKRLENLSKNRDLMERVEKVRFSFKHKMFYDQRIFNRQMYGVPVELKF